MSCVHAVQNEHLRAQIDRLVAPPPPEKLARDLAASVLVLYVRREVMPLLDDLGQSDSTSAYRARLTHGAISKLLEEIE